MKIIKKEDLNLPDHPGLAPQINWGKDFEDWDKDHQLRYLKKLCSALNHATDLIQKERDALLEKMEVLKVSTENADSATSIQKNIVLNAITSHNKDKQNLIQRIQELEKEVKDKDKLLKLYEM